MAPSITPDDERRRNKAPNCTMTDQNNELNQEADALNGLPDVERQETQKILDEIASETAPKEDDKPSDDGKPEPKPEDKKPEEGGKPKEDDDGKKPEPRRETKLMPAWLHERAKADWEKREAELKSEVEKARGTATKLEESQEPTKDAEALAEKHGITVELAQEIIESRNAAGKIPQEIAEKLKLIDEMKNATAIEAEVAGFKADFDAKILPLIKVEYGENVPESTIEQIREELKTKAYTPEYAKVPYTILYKGDDTFRGLISPERKGAEGGRGGSTAQQEMSGQGEPIDLSKTLSDDVIKTLTDDQFETYSANMEKNERAKGK